MDYKLRISHKKYHFIFCMHKETMRVLFFFQLVHGKGIPYEMPSITPIEKVSESRTICMLIIINKSISLFSFTSALRSPLSLSRAIL